MLNKRTFFFALLVPSPNWSTDYDVRLHEFTTPPGHNHIKPTRLLLVLLFFVVPTPIQQSCAAVYLVGAGVYAAFYRAEPLEVEGRGALVL